MMLPSREEALAYFAISHSGVKGMKWGVRKKKLTRNDIVSARVRQNQLYEQLYKERAKSKDQSASAATRRAAANRAKKLEVVGKTSEDRVTAAHLSRGEKVGWVILAGPLGLAVIGANSLAISAIKKNTDKHRKITK